MDEQENEEEQQDGYFMSVWHILQVLLLFGRTVIDNCICMYTYIHIECRDKAFLNIIDIQIKRTNLTKNMLNTTVTKSLIHSSASLSSLTTKFIDYKAGPPQNLHLSQRKVSPSQDQYLLKIKAVGINRAECLHRAGRYPVNPNIQVEKYIGLEAAGEVINVQTGEKMFDGIALLSGGSYAQWTTVPKTHVMKMPKNLSYQEGAAIPEAWLTAFQLIGLAQLKQGQKVVIYAGASGVGTAAIQICNSLGYIPYAVVSGKQKGEICKKYGVKDVVYYKDNQNWQQQLLKINQGKPFDAVLDCVGPGNAKHTTKLLGVDGRWVFYGTLSGIKGEVNFGELIGKRIKLISTTLKSRSKEYKDDLINRFSQTILPKFEQKKVFPVIDRVLKCDWNSADCFIEAHKIMESNQNSGKIIIQYL